MNENASALKASHSTWPASLQLVFQEKQQKTIVSTVKHFGPLRIQRPFYPEKDGTCHLYLLHPPGGIVGGDELTVQCDLQENSQALITTPGAGKIYRSNRASSIKQKLQLASQSILEWMPQETILYPGAKINMDTTIRSNQPAKIFFWDVLSFGMPATNQIFTDGVCEQNVQVLRDENLIFLEKNRFCSDGDIMQSDWGMRGFFIHGFALFSAAKVPEILSQLRLSLDGFENVEFAFTQKSEFIICRCLGNNIEAVRELLIQVWRIWRENEINKALTFPRIWNT